MGKIQIDILGTSFSAQTAEDDDYLRRLLSYYTKITDSIASSSGVSDPIKVSILAGIALVDELYKEKEKNAVLMHSSAKDSIPQEDDDKIEEIAQNVIERLNGALL